MDIFSVIAQSSERFFRATRYYPPQEPHIFYSSWSFTERSLKSCYPLIPMVHCYWADVRGQLLEACVSFRLGCMPACITQCHTHLLCARRIRARPQKPAAVRRRQNDFLCFSLNYSTAGHWECVVRATRRPPAETLFCLRE